jgi:signal transduction histidine kinase/ActR/RegA family two-component response regulator
MTQSKQELPDTSPSKSCVMQKWRERIFKAIFISFLIFGTVSLFSSAQEVIRSRMWGNLAIYLAGFLVVALIVLFRRIPFHYRAWMGLFVFFGFGLTAEITIGSVGSGRLWLLAFSIVATLLLGLRVGVITLFINALALVIMGFLIANGEPFWAAKMILPVRVWIVISITFLFVASVLTIALGVLVRALEENLLKEKQLTGKLTAANENLRQDQEKQKKLEKSLIESEKKLSQAIQGNSVPTFIIDGNHIISHWNHACEALTGLSASRMVGSDDQWMAFHPSKSPVLADLVLEQEQNQATIAQLDSTFSRSELIKGGYDGEIFVPSLGKSGKWLFLTAAPLRDLNGESIGAIQTFYDITDRVTLAEQLRQAQKLESIGRLAGGVAHDYNNISSVIIGYSELTLESLDKDDLLYENISKVLDAAKRSSDITRQLLAFARQQTVAPKIIDLNQVVSNMVKMLGRLVGEDIDIFWHPNEQIWPVRMDPSQVNQIMANLCVNARDAISDVGKITIETRNASFDEEFCKDHLGFMSGDYVMLSVTDDGHGIALEDKDKIFEPFFTTKEMGKGTGLGLATVYGIVKQNDGFIDVYSEPGAGTTFKIYLSRHIGEVEDVSSEKSAEIPISCGETILLVEDDASILALGKRIMSELGYGVVSTDSPMDAIRLAKEHSGKIDLLVTDVVMPEMNGRELSEQLILYHANLKTLFMSGYTSDVIAHRGVLQDGVSFLSKPFTKREMAIGIREALKNDQAVGL